MNAAEIDAILRPTLTDFRISPGEKESLRPWLEAVRGDPQLLGLVRSRAFAMARGELLDPGSKSVLEWLEGVCRILQPAEPRTAPESPTATKALFSPGNECVTEVISQFQRARSSCDVCVFTITDDRITRAILAAHARGVAVRLVTDDDKSTDLGSDIAQLRDAGVPVKFDHTPFHMHHKFALFDASRLLTGSFNWTRSATENNEENLILTADATLVLAFGRRFDQLWTRLENA